MSIRLSSFLSDIERGLKPADPILKGGAWDASRTLNYNIRLARLSLGVKREGSSIEPLGEILLQAFDLPDGSLCLKVSLAWSGQGEALGAVRLIFEKPGVNWTSEAAKIADMWSGAPQSRNSQGESRLPKGPCCEWVDPPPSVDW